MVLTSLFAPRGDRPRRLSFRSSSSQSPEPDASSESLEIHEDAPPEPEVVEDPNLRTLNDSLLALAAIFPDVQPEVFREMLISFDEESRLHVVTEALLKHKAKWVRGRWRLPEKDGVPAQRVERTTANADERRRIVPLEQQFRSLAYRRAVKDAFYHEFRGLSHSAINALLAENNHSYTSTRPILLGLATKSWRFSLSSFFFRRKTISSGVESHPLIAWRVAEGDDDRKLVPTLRHTASAELNQELLETLLVPVLQRQKAELQEKDWNTAVQLNDLEAEECDALHECQCCYMPTSFEQLSSCDQGGHFICFRCVRHAVNEALFGQGWNRNIEHEKGSLRCFAPILDGKGDCSGCIPQALVNRALSEEKGGDGIWRKFEERLAEEALLKSRMSLVKCPYCIYAEVDEIYVPPTDRHSWRFKRTNLLSLSTIFIFLLSIGLIPFLIPLLIVIFSLLTLTNTIPAFLKPRITTSLSRVRRSHRGLKFTCQNPLCARSSCLACHKEWRDIHTCFESERAALRAAIERAMAEAIKRTCPHCNLSFVKSSGCNKLTCVCGYQMCYVCRKDIAREGYTHFCEHFRPNPGSSCLECVKCDLYRCEDEEVSIRKAGERAEKEWRENQGVGAGEAAAFTSGTQGLMDDKRWGSFFMRARRMPRWEEVLDWTVDILIE
ncbi:MAG: hypothetical protein M1819_003228 [Sarea resinae]|nr:MAG: hypothetical protein M1819_003228 [Sarea resinae]